MDCERFKTLLRQATQDTLNFTRRFVWDTIPDKVVYRLDPEELYDSSSPEGKLLIIDPEDSLGPEGFLTLTHVEIVAKYLCQDGRVPVWIDLTVVEAAAEFTTIELMCCGRYSDQEEHLYYTPWGRGPFGVKGPAVPPGWQFTDPIQKFDLRWMDNTPGEDRD